MTSGLHLNDLVIRGFRCIKDLHISTLGQVTILAGRNGIGKTTVLEAVQLFATRGQLNGFDKLLSNRGEDRRYVDSRGKSRSDRNWTSLFHGRSLTITDSLRIGPTDEPNCVRISPTPLSHKEISRINSNPNNERVPHDAARLEVKYRESITPLPLVFSLSSPDLLYNIPKDSSLELYGILSRSDPIQETINCQNIGPGLISDFMIQSLWENIVLTPDESQCVDAINRLFDQDVSQIAVIHGENNTLTGASDLPNILVKMSGTDERVSLKTLGDGTSRVFAVALALANSKNGFLTIDEAENGIHYSAQRKFWTMVLQTAYANRVQVLATTHSWDTIVGFAQASMDCEADIDTAVVRLQRGADGQVRAVEYSKEQLMVAAEQDIEVR